MTGDDTRALLARIAALQTELVELAFELDSRRRHDAADVAMSISARLGELHTESPDEPVRREPAHSLRY